MRNANRILAADLPLTSDQYARLVDTAFRLAKSVGKDTTEAINLLTDALVRGNTRGLQAVGIHLAVRDAVSAMAEASGQSANKLADHSRLQAFYNEVLEKTDAVVAKLGPRFLTILDILTQGDRTWSGSLSTFGMAIGRSAVLQDVMEKLNQKMLKIGANSKDLDQITLATNRFIISALRGFADLCEGLGALSTAWDLVWGTAKFVINGLAILVAGLADFGYSVVYQLFNLLAKVPGQVGKTARKLADEYFVTMVEMHTAVGEFAKATVHSYDGFGKGEEKLNAMAASSRTLADQLTKLSDGILDGKATMTGLGDGANKSAVDVEKLNQQLKTYHEMLAALQKKSSTPAQAAWIEYGEELRRIQSLDLISQEQRNQLAIAAQIFANSTIMT